MMTTELLAALAVFAFVSSITPGPNNLMLMTSGINFGLGRTVPHLLGVALGFTLMIALIGLGIMQVIEAVPGSVMVITIASGLYLLYMAWKIATTDAAPAEAGSTSKPFTFLQAALFQWVNPKAWTMALAAISAYAPKSSGWVGVVIVAAVFGIINLPSIGAWAMMGVKMRRFLGDPVRLRAFNIVAALLLVASLYPMVTPLLA